MLALALLFSLRLGALGLASCENDCDENSGPGLSLVQMSISGLPKQAQRVAVGEDVLSCLLLEPELHEAVRQLLSAESGDGIGRAWSLLASQLGCHPEAFQRQKEQAAFRRHKASLLKLLGSLSSSLRLKPQEPPVTFPNGTTLFTFDSVDMATDKIGTGELGQFGEDASVFEVALRANQTGPFLWDLSPAEMTFTIGPAIRGMFLISGSLFPLTASAEGVTGRLKAGFVNLHSTATGTWTTGMDMPPEGQ